MCEHDDFKREGDKCEICPDETTGNKSASVTGLSCLPIMKYFIKSRMDMKPLLEADDKKYQQGRREELAIIFFELLKMENAR